MSLPYFNLYPADFEADTSHLTLEEDGAYNRLLRLMWMMPDCTLPDDAAWLRRRMRVDQETFDRVVSPLINEFLQRRNGRIFSARLMREFKKADETSRKRSTAGKMGGRPKAIEKKEQEQKPGFEFDKGGLFDTRALPEPKPDPDPEVKEEPSGSSKKTIRASRLPEDWHLPEDWRQEMLEKGVSEEIVRSQAERFRNYWISKAGKDATKLSWLATWRNWMQDHVDRAKAASAVKSQPYRYVQGGIER